MSGYRRFVAYVYEYQKGKKGRNCGFIRVEAKEQVCRMEAHILCPGLTPNVRCEIFGFTRKTGLLDGVLLGSCMTEDSRADCVLETERDHMGGSAMTLENMGGMILLTENGAFFGTEWDDKPIRPENFRRVKAEAENKRADKDMNPQSSTINSRSSEEELPEEMKSEKEQGFWGTKSEEEMQGTPIKDNNNCQEMHDLETGQEEEVRESRPEETNVHQKERDSETKAAEGKPKAQSEENNPCGESQNMETKTAGEMWKEKKEDNVYKETMNQGTREEFQKAQSEENNPCEKSQNMEIKTAGEMWKEKKEDNVYKETTDQGTREDSRKAQSEENNICEKSQNMEIKTAGETQKDKLGGNNLSPSENNLKQETVTAEKQCIPAERHLQKVEAEKEIHTSEKSGTEYLTSQSVSACNQGTSKAKEKLISFGDPIDAFGDGEIFDCRKIQPADLCHFYPRDCGLRNNRFLQYGFYNFGHLLIGKNSSGHYILGVPGGYDQQERFMANMFGFPYFKESRQIQLPKSRGGYWYRLINPPKLY